MTIIEVHQDLFTVPKDYTLVHCISADFALGAGIAKEFNKRFNMKRKLQSKYPDYFDIFIQHHFGGGCIYIYEDRVLNLVTKERYFEKPSIYTMKIALQCMKEICLINGITKLAMPKIGCGLDRLQWSKVKQTIEEMFADTDIEIRVCSI